MNFSSYWKEIAVVLAAFFAVAGTVFEVKDKVSHRITIWGRMFFGMTIISMIGGFYAQWEENAHEVKRNKQSQDEMLKIIENTNKNLYDITRILQPLGKSDIVLSFRPNCIESKEFCDTALELAEKERTRDNVVSFSLHDVDWTKWPHRRGEFISLHFFKDRSTARAYLGGNCIECDSDPEDISFHVPFYVGEDVALGHNPSVVVMYQAENKELAIGAYAGDVSPRVKGDRILSTIDLPGSTLTVRASGGLFKILTLIALTIRTERGQVIYIENPAIVNVKNETVFEYVFPNSTQH